MRINWTTIAIVSGLAIVGGGGSAVGNEKARGVVFEDRNSNGQRDPGEPGLPGVVVSNQFEVVVTDADGKYELPVTDDTIIYVVKPAGYQTPVDKLMLPRFYYIHKPAGSPPLHYGGIDPTGPLPESIDFPLVKVDEPQRFTMVALADPQPETSQEVYYVRDDVLTELVGCGAAFGVTLGDIMSDRLELYDMYNRAVALVGIPFYNVIGNHDLNFDAADDRDSDETFHRHYGPNYYSFNYGQVHFVVADNVEWKGPGKGGGNYRGYFGERQLTWLARDLEHVPDDHLVVIMTHIPLTTPIGYPVDDLAELFDTLKGRKRILALNGHTHFQEQMFFHAEAGFKGEGDFHQFNVGTVSGAWWSGPKDVRGIPTADNRDGVPNGYALITFDGADYVADYRAANHDRDLKMWIYPPGTTAGDDKSTKVMVNVFAGTPRCQVQYSLDRGEFVDMQRSPQRDPRAMAIISGVLDSGKPWANPNVCHHIWTADLPAPPGRGQHILTIRHQDHYGRTHEQSHLFGR